MISRYVLAAVGLSALGSFCPLAEAQISSSPQYDQLGRERAAGEDPTYQVNRYGFGNYVQGPNGAYGAIQPAVRGRSNSRTNMTSNVETCRRRAEASQGAVRPETARAACEVVSPG